MAVLRLMTSSNLVGCLHRQVAGLLALKDAIDVGAVRAILIELDQTRKRSGRRLGRRHERDISPAIGACACELDDPGAMNGGQCARHHDQAAIRPTREGGDGAIDLGDVAQVDRAQFHPKR